MRCAVVFVAGALAVVMTASVLAQELETPMNLFARKQGPPKPPKIDWNWRPAADRTSSSKPTVVCGMTLVPADPKLDPKMRAESPERGVMFAVRAVPPTVCKAP